MLLALAAVVLLLCPAPASAQATATLQGRVFDSSGGALPGADISLRSRSTGSGQAVRSDLEGRYAITLIPAGTYTVTVAAPGFRSAIIQELIVEVGRTLVRDFQLSIGDRTERLTVEAEWPLIDRSTSVGHVVSGESIQALPLNGRRFLDIALLVAGSMSPSQAGFSTMPIRGRGALAINTAGNREEAVGYLINGISTNNLTFGSITLQPPLASLQEFRVENSTFSPEFGHVSGAIVSVVTRSGTDRYQAGLFELGRNEALDAPNFFESGSGQPSRFERHQFGGWLGGPLAPQRTFFFVTYEGLRQRQGLDLNSLVLNDEQRGAASDPTVRRLIELIPRANAFDADGTPRFVGKGEAAVDTDSWSMDVRHQWSDRGRMSLFYTALALDSLEPMSQGNSIPGFGHVRRTDASVFTIGETHTLGSHAFNELRLGRSRQDGLTWPRATLNPFDFGISNGVLKPIGLPQIVIAGGLNFGGPSAYPQGRIDTSYVLTEAMSYARGRHLLRFGGETRLFLNDNFAEGTGQFNFPTVASFLAGSANAFSITLGERRNRIRQRALGLFVQDRVNVSANLTLDLGLRYDWHVTPTEQDDRFVVFDAARVTLVRVGVDIPRIYQQNARNFEPRLGLAWDPFGTARTIMRAAYSIAVDEPGTTAVRDTAGNPPFATPFTASGAIPLSNALATVQPAGLAPMTVEPGFRNAHLHAWNVNIQHLLRGRIAAMVGYFGSQGEQLRISRNLNQPVDGVRPYPALSLSSPILPGTPLGNITQVESSGFSSYHGLWVSVSRRLSQGLQFDASYTLSRSRDTNSLNSSDFAIQNSYDIEGQYGLSDFDARHRFVASILYSSPASGSALTRHWQMMAVIQAQSGNPLNLVTNNSGINGTPNTVRPDLTGPIRILGIVNQWFDPSSFEAVNRFGSLPRNVVIGPGFGNVDLSLARTMHVTRGGQLQLRIDVFNVFSQINLGPPGIVVGSPTFAKISRTRLPVGEAGSSRQIQLGVQVSF